MPVSKETIDILNKYKDQIESNEWGAVYTGIPIAVRPAITDLLYGADINPLTYLDAVPDYFAYGSVQLPEEIVLDDKVTSIGGRAFSQSSIKKVVIPKSVQHMFASCFERCEQLEEAVVSADIKRLFYYTFSRCSKLKTLTFTDDCTLKEFGGSCVYFCESLETVTLPKLLNSIGSSSFAYCSSLKTVNGLDHVEEIHTGAFHKCRSLTKVDLSDDLFLLSEQAFLETGLTSVDLSHTKVSQLNGLVFAHCTALSEIKLPMRISFGSAEAFTGCTALKDIYYVGTRDDWHRHVSFEPGWDRALPNNYAIHCTDGDLLR